jgi:hypothetical protein
MTDSGIWMPTSSVVDGTKFYRPGIVGNLLVSGVSAAISWAMYGALATEYIFGAESPAASAKTHGLTLSALAGAVLVGMAGARWLTNEVDKSLLRVTATVAASKSPSPTVAAKIANVSPAEALKLVQEIP